MTQEKTSPRESKVCPDCQGNLEPIRILDKGHYSIPESFEYASLDAKPGFWTGYVSAEGRIEALICTSCARILFYCQATLCSLP